MRYEPGTAFLHAPTARKLSRMCPEQHQIIRTAERLQRRGRVGDSMHLRILADEVPEMVFGPVVTHGPEDVPEAGDR